MWIFNTNFNWIILQFLDNLHNTYGRICLDKAMLCSLMKLFNELFSKTNTSDNLKTTYPEHMEMLLFCSKEINKHLSGQASRVHQYQLQKAILTVKSVQMITPIVSFCIIMIKLKFSNCCSQLQIYIIDFLYGFSFRTCFCLE